ncbi:hypothetical protein Tco_0254446, partial [Tanacetum coccineum]
FYDGGKVNWFDQIDSDSFSVVEVTHMLAGLGYVNPRMQYWYKIPNKNALLPLSNDSDVLRFIKYVDKFKVMQLYVLYLVDKPKPVGLNENLDIEEDFDLFFCDLDPDSSELNASEVPNVGEPSEMPNVGEPSEVPNVADQTKMPNVANQTEMPNVADQTEMPNVREHSDGSEDSEDGDFDVELEDKIDDADVDMDDLRKFTDENVEWVGPNEVLVEDT